MLYDLQIFFGKVSHPEPPHAQSLFLFPIVFGINLIQFSMGEQCRTGQDVLSFRSLVARLAPFGRFGTKRAKFFGNGKCELSHCEFQLHNGDHLTKSANFWQGKV